MNPTISIPKACKGSFASIRRARSWNFGEFGLTQCLLIAKVRLIPLASQLW